jgi:hypothetical protein
MPAAGMLLGLMLLAAAPASYCTGQRVTDDAGVPYYPNGQRVVDGFGKEYYPNGTRLVNDYGDEISRPARRAAPATSRPGST